jgi:undecaprenyl-diphosphatase
MNLLEVVILAVLQGIAEFLPISSSGHLVLAQHFLGASSPGIALEVVLHLGTLAAVVILYARDIAMLAAGVFRLRRDSLRLLGLLALASIPAGVVGLLFEDALEGVFDSPSVVAFLLVLNGLALTAAGLGRKAAEKSGPGAVGALAAGLAQAVAILPGISRSGSTIAALTGTGVSPAGAARFSFLMSIPAVAAAGALKAAGGFPAGGPGGPLLVAGFAVSLATGLFALRLLLRALTRGKLWVFGAYCVAAGTICSVLMLTGV